MPSLAAEERTLHTAASGKPPTLHLTTLGHASRMRMGKLSGSPMLLAGARGRSPSGGKVFSLAFHILLVLFLVPSPAFGVGPHSHDGPPGLPLPAAATGREEASAVHARDSLKPVDSVQRRTGDAAQLHKGPAANQSQRQKEAQAQISSSSDGQESRESRLNKAKMAAENHAVPPGLAADSNISIRRPFDLLRKAAALFGDSPWLLTSEEDGGEAFSKITYKQGYAVALAVGSGLDRLVPPSQLPQHDGANEPLRLVGTWADNSVELLLADFGGIRGSGVKISAGAFGMTVVPMHPEMNARRFLEVVIHTQMTHLCADWRHLEIVLDLREGGQLSNLSAVITLDAVGDQAVQRAQALDLALVDFWELADSPNGIGEHRLKTLHRSGFDTEEIAAVIYPRALSMPFNGAMLSNENVLASLDTLTDWRARALFIMEGDRMLCIDSLASIHQRVLHLAVVEAGATVAFARSGLLTLGKDLETLQPTIIAASGGILPMLHAAAKRTLKSMGRLRRFWVLLKLRLRARRYWQTGDFELLGRPPFEELKAQLAPVHTIIAAPALVSSELIKELQLLYSVVIVHACCSAETGIAFSSREQNNSLSGSNDSSSASGVGTPSEFGRVRAAPLGWPSPVVVVDLEELSAADKANAIDYHGEEVPGKRSGGSPLVLKTSKDHTHQQIVSISRRRRRSRLNGRKKHSVTEGEIAIQGPCVSVGYYRHQTAFQRQLTPRGLYKTGLVGISTGDGFPFLLTSSLSRSVLTAEGEFIDLEEAERQIRKVHIVKRVLLYVDDFHSPLVAIVQPRKGAVFRWAKTRFAFADEYGASYEELVSLPALRKFVLHAIQEETSLSLEHFELPKAVYLVPHDVELPVAVFDQGKNGPNKSSHLMSRRQLAEAYAQPIQEMYWQLNE